MSSIEIFALGSDAQVRFGSTESGDAYAVASDFAKALGYTRTSDAVKLLDDDEKGAAICRTPGGSQEMTVIYEDGMWELIFRSTLPGAKALKGRVKEILKEIRKTGSYGVAPALPQSFAEALQLAADQAKELEAAKPAIAFHSAVVADEESWLEMQEVAKEICSATGLGRNNLMTWMKGKGYLTQANLPAQHLINSGKARVSVKVVNGKSYQHSMFTQAGVDWILRKFSSDNNKD